MSERTFFSLRYALPGYTFILMAILVAYPKLQDILLQKEYATLVGAFLAFLALLSGGALGFLVSQVWYVIFNRFISLYFGKIPKTRGFLTREYGLSDEKYHQIVFLDYVHRLTSEEMRIYTQRRYDLMHLAGSTLFSTLIGSLSGVLIRIDVFRTDIKLFPSKEPIDRALSSISKGISEITCYDFLVILILASLVVLLSVCLWHACKELAMAIEISVREVVYSGTFPVDVAKEIFPEDYFDNEKSK